MPKAPTIAAHWRQLFTILALLRGRGQSIEQMATARGSDFKTVRRDMERLTAIGFDLRCAVEPFGLKRWRVVAPLKTIKQLME